MGKKLIILLAICLCLASCTSELSPPDQPIEELGTVIVDSLGREVEIPKVVNRICALDPQSATFLIMFGAGERLVGVSGGVKRNLLLQEISPNLESVSVPQTSGTVNFEEIARLEPDIILIKKDSYTDIFGKDMELLQIPVIVVSTESIEDQMNLVMLLKHFLRGEELERADNFLEFYVETIDTVKSRTAARNDADIVTIFHSTNQAVRTAKYPSLPTDWLEVVGVRNVTINEELDETGDSYYATLEQIFLWNPDVIVCNEFGVPDYMMSEAKWQGLAAVENGQVYQMPVGFSRWGHYSTTETPLAMLWLGKTIYPEDYQDIDLYEKSKEFYRDVAGIELTPELFEKIMQGEEIRTAKSEGRKEP